MLVGGPCVAARTAQATSPAHRLQAPCCTLLSSEVTRQDTSSQLRYGGWCTRCTPLQQHWLQADGRARRAAEALMQQLEQHQRLDFATAHADPRFHIDCLFTRGPGRMFGVLVCAVPPGMHMPAQTHGDAALSKAAMGAPTTSHADASCGELVVLKAFSGQMEEEWHVPGWVGPVASITNSSAVYVRMRRLIEAHSSRLHALGSSDVQLRHAQKGAQLQDGRTMASYQQERQNSLAMPPAQRASPPPQQQRQQQRQERPRQQHAPVQHASSILRRRRRALSHALLRHIQTNGYSTMDAAGRPLDVLQVYMSYRQQHPEEQVPVTRLGSGPDPFLGFPAGTGDCAALKLLHAAASLGLHPLSLAEFWFGSAPGTATKAKAGQPALPPSAADSRVHKRYYGCCAKCSAILGSMLCDC